MKPIFLDKMAALWKEFLPLSVSDVTMAMGDPLVNTTLAHLPKAETNLGGLGVVKALVVLFESPIIMVLHASNTLAKKENAAEAMWRFVLLACAILTSLLSIIAIPGIFAFVAQKILGISEDMAKTAHVIFICLLLWPASIAWRRYFQGILIAHGQLKPVARAGFLRLIVLFSCLVLGYKMEWKGSLVAGVSLMIGILAESFAITVAGFKYRKMGILAAKKIASDDKMSLKGIWKFYWPLAHSMVLVWGGRALLVACLARSVDSAVALALWPLSWALVLVFANATRMVQQVIIRNKHDFHPYDFVGFAFSVGLILSLFLLFLGLTSTGTHLVSLFVGQDKTMTAGVQNLLLYCSGTPIFVALQNAFQGLLMSQGKTKSINEASLVGIIVLLTLAIAGVSLGYLGAKVAAIAMMISLSAEIIMLCVHVPWGFFKLTYSGKQEKFRLA